MSSLGARSDISNREETITKQSGASLYLRDCVRRQFLGLLWKGAIISVCVGLKKGKTHGQYGLVFFFFFPVFFFFNFLVLEPVK